MSINRFGEVTDRDGEETKEGGEIVPFYIEPKRTHIIMVNGSYTGPLKKGTTQFSFGHHLYDPQNYEPYSVTREIGTPSDNIPLPYIFHKPVFIVPHSGKIKKIKMVNPLSSKPTFFFTKLLTKKKDEYFGKGFFEIINSSKGVIGGITCSEEYGLPLSNPWLTLKIDFCFDDDLPLKNLEVKEGDVINIISSVDVDIPFVTGKQMEDFFKSFGYKPDDLKPDEAKLLVEAFETFSAKPNFSFPLFSTYLVSILIELDPL